MSSTPGQGIVANNDDAYWYAKYMKYKAKYMKAKELMGGSTKKRT